MFLSDKICVVLNLQNHKNVVTVWLSCWTEDVCKRHTVQQHVHTENPVDLLLAACGTPDLEWVVIKKEEENTERKLYLLLSFFDWWWVLTDVKLLLFPILYPEAAALRTCSCLWLVLFCSSLWWLLISSSLSTNQNFDFSTLEMWQDLCVNRVNSSMCSESEPQRGRVLIPKPRGWLVIWRFIFSSSSP